MCCFISSLFYFLMSSSSSPSSSSSSRPYSSCSVFLIFIFFSFADFHSLRCRLVVFFLVVFFFVVFSIFFFASSVPSSFLYMVEGNNLRLMGRKRAGLTGPELHVLFTVPYLPFIVYYPMHLIIHIFLYVF